MLSMNSIILLIYWVYSVSSEYNQQSLVGGVVVFILSSLCLFCYWLLLFTIDGDCDCIGMRISGMSASVWWPHMLLTLFSQFYCLL